jgi:hypothetical protein
VVGGVINTSRQVGAAIGAALLPAIALTVSHGDPQAGADGARAAMLAGAAAAMLATVIAWRSVRASSPAPQALRHEERHEVHHPGPQACGSPGSPSAPGSSAVTGARLTELASAGMADMDIGAGCCGLG